jgi:hypothetical protein
MVTFYWYRLETVTDDLSVIAFILDPKFNFDAHQTVVTLVFFFSNTREARPINAKMC